MSIEKKTTKMDEFDAARAKRMEDIAAKKARVAEMRKQKAEREALKSAPPLALHNESADEASSDATKGEESSGQSAVSSENIPVVEVNELAERDDVQLDGNLSQKQIVNSSSATRSIEAYDKQCQTESITENEINVKDGDNNESHGAQSPDLPAVPTPTDENIAGLVPPRPPMTQAEQAQILSNTDFLFFINQSSKIIERSLLSTTNAVEVLGEGNSGQADITIDYRKEFVGDSRDKASMHGHGGDFAALSSLHCESTQNRPIMSMQYCPQRPELYLCAYGAKISSIAGRGLSQVLPTQQESKDNTECSTSVDSIAACNADGLVCLWALNLPSRPEFTFVAPSPVLMAKFHPTKSYYILGSCYSGQLCLWDMRSGQSQPMKVSGAGMKNLCGHKQPVYNFLITSLCNRDIKGIFGGGGASASSIIVNDDSEDIDNDILSTSVDGNICCFHLSNMEEGPVSVAYLNDAGVSRDQATSNISTKSNIDDIHGTIGISALGELSSSSSGGKDIIFGSCIGNMYRASLGEITGESGISRSATTVNGVGTTSNTKHFLRIIGAHVGMISSIHIHPDSNSINSKSKLYRNLILTSSLDWAVKLWKLPYQDEMSSGRFTPSDNIRPLLEFRTADYEYVCDVQWNPLNPAVFSCITSGGTLSIWNLSRSISDPVSAISVTSLLSSSNNASLHSNVGAFNKIIWSKNGTSLFLGTSDGTLHHVRITDTLVAAASDDDSRVELAIFNAVTNDPHAAAGGGNNGDEDALDTSTPST